MAIVKTSFNRRSFLKASALAGGGMMLGFNWACAPAAEEALAMPDAWYAVNAFMKIGNNGVVTIMSPNPEIGQNVKTAMPMIIAEELDVDWKKVIVEQAGLDTENFTGQVAGGSQSIRRGWKGLRMAGATARRMLLEAAAQRLEVAVDELTTDSGVITHVASGQTLGYGEVAEAAAGVEIPEKVELKDPTEFKIIGTAQKNVDGPKIVTGEPLFGLDFHREGMLYAAIVHPPGFGMKLKSMDDAAARAMPGIRDVVTINIDPDSNFPNLYAFPEQVAVVGNSTWDVFKAKQALQIEWEPDAELENTSTQEEKLVELLSKGGGEPARRDGNPEAAFSNAAKVIERTFTAPFLPHNTLEPMNFFADVKEDHAELVGPIQTPQWLRQTVSGLLDMPEENISIDMTRMGGGFGRRLFGNFGMEAALISKAVKAPVKVVYTREDDMTQGTYRPTYKVTYRAALDADNNLVGFHVKGAGVHESPIFENRYPAGAVDNYLAEKYSLDSRVSTGAWRAPRSNFIAGAEQSFLDEVAEEAGKDPIDFRLELFERAINSPVGEDNDYDAERYAGVLKLVREKSGWDTEMPGVHRGVSAYFCHNSYVAQVLDVVMENDRPKVQKVWCAVDCGIVINPGSAKNQIEGGIVDGIGHAMFGAQTIADGRPEKTNFDTYRLIRNAEAPVEIETFFVDNGIDPTGLGEPSLPPAPAALANAIARATGQRLYTQPFVEQEGLEVLNAIG